MVFFTINLKCLEWFLIPNTEVSLPSDALAAVIVMDNRSTGHVSIYSKSGVDETCCWATTTTQPILWFAFSNKSWYSRCPCVVFVFLHFRQADEFGLLLANGAGRVCHMHAGLDAQLEDLHRSRFFDAHPFQVLKERHRRNNSCCLLRLSVNWKKAKFWHYDVRYLSISWNLHGLASWYPISFLARSISKTLHQGHASSQGEKTLQVTGMAWSTGLNLKIASTKWLEGSD